MSRPQANYRHLFGPVPSRRLGRSLGVDLVPFKTCSYDCLFCQLGPTTCKTVTRREYVPVADIMAELDAWLDAGGQADYITLSGSGEPTLNTAFGQVIDFVRGRTNIPVALLTNASLLSDPAVRGAAARAHVLKVSLSAPDANLYARINRPHVACSFDALLTGLRQAREAATGQIWLEVFLLRGINDQPDEVARIAELARVIEPDKIHLNTVVRPAREAAARPVPERQLQDLARLFTPEAEVIADYSGGLSARIQATEEGIEEMLKRRPCTPEQIGQVFGLHANEVSKYLGQLIRTGRVRSRQLRDAVYYEGLHTLDFEPEPDHAERKSAR